MTAGPNSFVCLHTEIYYFESGGTGIITKHVLGICNRGFGFGGEESS